MNDLTKAERTALSATVLVLIAIVAAIAFKFVFDPMKDRRLQLEDQLAAIRPVEVSYEKPNWAFDQWQQSMEAKSALWKALIEPPPPPPKPPPPPPDMAKLLAGVTAGRAQVGGKVKITKQGEQRGVFMGIGDEVNNCVIKEITKSEVIFSVTHLDKELTYSVPRN